MTYRSVLKHFVLILMGLVFFKENTIGQLSQTARYEIPQDWTDMSYVVINNDKQGITVIQPKVKGSDPKYELYFDHLDRDLKLKWRGSFQMSRQMNLVGYHYSMQKTYLLFQNRVNNRFFQLVSLNTEQKNIVVFDTIEILDITMQYFEMVQQTAVIGGYREDKPVVVAYNPEDGSVNTLENIYQSRAELAEVRINQDSVTFNVLTSVLNDRKERTLEVHTYDYQGNYIRGYQLESEPKYHLLTGISSSIRDKAQVVTGLYTTKNGSYPSGIFIHHIDKTGKQAINFYNFGEFNTFLDHLGDKRANRLKERARNKLEINGDWRFKTDVFFRPMLETEDEYMVMAEFYKPWSFSTENYNLNRIGLRRYSSFNTGRDDPYRPLNPRNYRTPKEFDFTHAFVISVSAEGHMNWDRSFTINSMHEGLIDEYGEFQWFNGQVYYSYYFRRELVASHINAQEKNEVRTKLTLMHPEEELKFEVDDSFDFTRWYDNFLLIHGVQRIKSPNEDGEIRRVFFINKLRFDPNFKNDGMKKE